MRTAATATALLVQLALLPIASAAVRFDEPPVEPAQPTSAQLIEARLIEPVACSFRSFVATRSGSVVTISYPDPELDCAGPITAVPVGVEVGHLDAGTYLFRLVNITDVSRPVIEDEAIVTVSRAPTPCGTAPSPQPRLCLLDGRFAVTAEWTGRDGNSGVGVPLPLSDESGAFWFARDESLEVLVRMSGSCGRNGHFWFLAGGTTNPNLGVTLRVLDLVTGIKRTFSSPVGRLLTPVRDVGSFPCGGIS